MPNPPTYTKGPAPAAGIQWDRWSAFVSGILSPPKWEDVNFGIVGLGKGSSAPDQITLGTSGGIEALAFDGNATTEQVYGCVEIPHDWLEESGLVPHIHWLPSTANAGNVKWQLEYRWVSGRDAGAIGTSTTVSVTKAAGGVAWATRRSDFPEIAGTGQRIGSQFVFRLFRNPGDAADTYPDDAAGLTFGLHYRRDGFGSRSIGTK